ncbi:MAG: MBL fold metallo-hydrolase [Pseudomonadota bacterium]
MTFRHFTRRSFIGGAGVAACLAASRLNAAPAADRVVLLGTKGGPSPSATRAEASVLIVAGGRPYLVDCPNGVAGQLARAGVRLTELGQIFITHDHSDHVIDASTLAVLAWDSGLDHRLTFHGPPPLGSIIDNGLAASRFDVEARRREEGRPVLRPLIQVQEQRAGGLVFRDQRVRVTAALVDHYTVKPALAYRFDTATRSIVISGDTTYSENLVRLAQGADLLIHEAMYLPAIGQLVGENAPRLREHLLRSHSTTEQVGLVAARAGVKKLVLSHLVPGFPTITDEMWLDGVRKHFHGQAVVGRDLMEV